MRAKCDSCDYEFEAGGDLTKIPDLAARLDPGGIVPVAECPKCSALAYLVSTNVWITCDWCAEPLILNNAEVLASYMHTDCAIEALR